MQLILRWVALHLMLEVKFLQLDAEVKFLHVVELLLEVNFVMRSLALHLLEVIPHEVVKILQVQVDWQARVSEHLLHCNRLLRLRVLIVNI
jgi:hypothetical protein